MDPAWQPYCGSWTFDPWLIVPLSVAAGLYYTVGGSCTARCRSASGVWRLGSFQLVWASLLAGRCHRPLRRWRRCSLQAHMAQHAGAHDGSAGRFSYTVRRHYTGWRGFATRGVKARAGTAAVLAGCAGGCNACSPSSARVVGIRRGHGCLACPGRSMNWPCIHTSGTMCSISVSSAQACLFWWPVLQPWPSRPRWPRWAMIPYLLLADIQNTALALPWSSRSASSIPPILLSTPMGHLGSRRPGSRRGHNVGARFARLSCASGVVGDATLNAPRTPRQDTTHHAPVRAETLARLQLIACQERPTSPHDRALHNSALL